jgi:hypothetical protein
VQSVHEERSKLCNFSSSALIPAEQRTSENSTQSAEQCFEPECGHDSTLKLHYDCERLVVTYANRPRNERVSVKNDSRSVKSFVLIEIRFRFIGSSSENNKVHSDDGIHNGLCLF